MGIERRKGRREGGREGGREDAERAGSQSPQHVLISNCQRNNPEMYVCTHMYVLMCTNGCGGTVFQHRADTGAPDMLGLLASWVSHGGNVKKSCPS